jgi:hypothetical protein
MNRIHIQDLLDKYFEGETSLREEKELGRYFRKTVLLPEEWEPYKEMFTYFKREGKRTMPEQHDPQRKKNLLWVAITGISLAATVLILLSIFIPATKTQLQPLASATKTIDTFNSKKEQPQKTESTKPAKEESKKTKKTKPLPERKILSKNPSSLLAEGKKEKTKPTSISTTISNALEPLDNLKAIDDALDKLKYFALLDKYLPNHDLSKFIKKGK